MVSRLPRRSPITAGGLDPMRSLVTILAFMTFVSSAFAQSTDSPTYSVGDTWTLKESGGGTREIKVLEVGDGGTTEMVGFLAQCPTCVVQLGPSLTILGVLDGGGKPADPTQIGFVPMGSAWQLYNFPLEPGKKWDFAMGRPRDVTWQTTNWFAPDVKFVVKTTSTNTNAQDTELLSYRIK